MGRVWLHIPPTRSMRDTNPIHESCCPEQVHADLTLGHRGFIGIFMTQFLTDYNETQL